MTDKTVNEEFELVDLDASNLRDYEELIGEADVMAFFPMGRYVWNIDRVNIAEQFNREAEMMEKNTIYVFKMVKVLNVREEDKDEVPDVGSKQMLYISNPVSDPNHWKNISWKEGTLLRRVALGKAVLEDRTPYREQLKMLEALYKENNYLACSIRHQLNKKTGEKVMKFSTDWEVWEESE